jgi:large subunit ribosomal protein L6
LAIQVPTGVKVHVDGARVRVEGPKGKLEATVEPGITVNVEGNTVTLSRADDERRTRGMHGLGRKLVANMVDGVAKGFTRVLEINGVGYRAEVKGRMLVFQLGYSHPIAVHLPEGMTAKVDRQVVITLEAADRQQLGEMAAVIRGLRPPEPYKGKGIKYAEETIRRKAGKAAAGASR